MTLTLIRKPFDVSKRRPAQVVLDVEDAGASPTGSTFWKRMRRCPREHALISVAGLHRTRVTSEALTIGWLFHLALENYYRANQDEAAAWKAISALSGEPGYEETFPEVERLLGHYFETYRREDTWEVLAVEETLTYEDEGLQYSARLDLVVKDRKDGRLWIVEHKTARAITPDLMSGYQMDMQVVGQAWLWDHCVDTSRYPTLAGVKVNIITKAKTPKVLRVEVCPSHQHRAAFEESMRQWAALETSFASLGWPKALGNCTGASRYFSQCDFFDVCHGRPEASVAQITAEEPPFGFERGGAQEGDEDDEQG